MRFFRKLLPFSIRIGWQFRIIINILWWGVCFNKKQQKQWKIFSWNGKKSIMEVYCEAHRAHRDINSRWRIFIDPSSTNLFGWKSSISFKLEGDMWSKTSNVHKMIFAFYWWEILENITELNQFKGYLNTFLLPFSNSYPKSELIDSLNTLQFVIKMVFSFSYWFFFIDYLVRLFLHTGQVRFFLHHKSKQSWWNIWEHGVFRNSISYSKSIKHTGHSFDSSISPGFALYLGRNY